VALASFSETAIATPSEQHAEIFEPLHQRLVPRESAYLPGSFEALAFLHLAYLKHENHYKSRAGKILA
jgi:hypothetical protein